MIRLLSVIAIVLSVVSCSTKKDVVYFQDIDDRQFEKIDSLFDDATIETKDILYVGITAADPESVMPFMFEKSEGRPSSRTSTSVRQLKITGYLVDTDGNINFPQLGTVKAKGKTLNELEKELEGKLSGYIKDPTINLRLVNNKITVLGEVASPGTFEVDEATLTLPQVLGKAGDLTINGSRKNVVIIRNENDRRIIKHLDLTKTDWMNSQFYNLKQNDVVYVEPNRPKIKTAGYVGQLTTLLSVISSAVSLVLLFLNLK